ncbi:MAG TPA: hypothetical protein PKX00_07715 [Opitutaceae bacterium]|nr:hypothetical protein [Opitutaceae bacterium]
MRFSLRAWMVIFGGLLLAAGAPLLQASGPVNDNFADAIALTGGVVSTSGTNVGATVEPSEPPPLVINPANSGASVWWTWTAPTTAVFVVNTIGSSFDTVLTIFTGNALTSLAAVASNDDFGTGSLTSALALQATAGVTYRIMVRGYKYTNESSPRAGTIQLNIGPSSGPPLVAVAPVDQEVFVGNTAQFSITVSGDTPIVYRWQWLPFQGGTWFGIGDSTDFAGTTTPTLTIRSSRLVMSGDQYRCVATNVRGSVTTSSAFLLVLPFEVTFLTQPTDSAVPQGDTARFSVAAAGPGPFLYRWQRMAVGGNTWVNLNNVVPYSDVTTATLSIASVTSTMNGDRFRCLVSNAQSEAASATATLSVTAPNQPPAFIVQPVSVSANEGTSVSFTTSFSGNPAPTLQWERSTDNGNTWLPLAGATSARLDLTNLLLSQNGQRYRARATNSIGSALSAIATLTVIEVIRPTLISLQPAGGVFRTGESTTLRVEATGTGPFQYAWFKDGRAVSGATASTLALTNLAAANVGGYHVVVTGRGGAAESSSALIQVLRAPVFTVQPVDVQVQVGLNAAFRAVVTGEPTPDLQWFSRTGSGAWTALTEGGPFRGVTSSLLSVSAASAAQNGQQFQVRATNAIGSVDSSIATLRTVATSASLRIRSQPQSALVRAGQSAQFTVDMEGDGPFTFQWSQNGVTRTGATTRICRLATTTADSVGGFSVVITDASGASVTSNVAYLTVAGAVDPAFDPRGGPDGEITDVISLIDGGLMVAGDFDRFAGVPRNRLVRLLKTGAVDTAFDPAGGPNGPVRAMLELTDNRYLIVGQFDTYDGQVVPGVVRIDSKGRLDPTFNADLPLPFIGRESEIPALERFQYAVIALRGGGYLLGGKLGLVALNTSGANLPESVFRTVGGVFSLVQQYDGGIVAGGDFTLMSGFVRARMARLSPDFRIDLTFDVGTGPNAPVRTLLRSPDGALYAMGSFTSFNGQPRPAGIAKLGPRGQLDLTYNPPLAPITAAGDFSSIANGNSRPSAGRLDAIRAGQVQPNGGLVVSNGSYTAQTVVAINPAGAVSTTESVEVAGAANAISITEDEDFAVAGQFSSLAGTDRNNVGIIEDASAWSRLTNLSCRARVSPSSGVLILGFVIQGPDSMRVLIRGAGPTLRNYGIADAVPRPQLTLFNSAGQVLQQNIGWQSGAGSAGLAEAMAQVGAFPFTNPEDTAILLNLAPGAYTAHIGGYEGSQGVALGEIYAVDLGRSRLVNSAVRGPVGTGENLLIPGFTVSGGSRLLLLRAVGPTLGAFGVPNTLAQPRMELKRSTGVLVASNQGWTTGFDPAALQARSTLVGAFPLGAGSADAAFLTPLEAGGFTITVSGADGGTGAALVEIYDANGVETPKLNQ